MSKTANALDMSGDYKNSYVGSTSMNTTQPEKYADMPRQVNMDNLEKTRIVEMIDEDAEIEQ